MIYSFWFAIFVSVILYIIERYLLNRFQIYVGVETVLATVSNADF